MFVHYSGTNVHALGFFNKANLKMNQSPQYVKGLQPGWNEIPNELWEQNKGNPIIKHMLAKKTITIMPDVVTVTSGGKKKKVAVGQSDVKIRLRWFEEKRAVEIVKQTFNRDVLQRWEEEEQRPKVVKALKKQIEPLLPSEEDVPDKDDFDEDEAEEENFFR